MAARLYLIDEDLSMIRTQEEYNNACDFINNDMELYDFQLSEKMSSYEYNLYLQDTEYFLNFLYEKIRTLEELCDYLDNYVDTKLRTAKDTIQINTTLLDTAVSVYQDTIDILPDWNQTVSTGIVDRDGTLLSIANYDADTIQPAARKDHVLEPQLIIKTETNQAYQDNLTTAIKDNMYIAAYQQTTWEPIQETVHITVPTGADFNCVDIEPINCALIIEKTEDGISVTMNPSGYEKELRNFDYLPYTGSNLSKIAQPDIQYASDQSMIANQTKQNAVYNQNASEQYVADIVIQQQTATENNNKAMAVNA